MHPTLGHLNKGAGNEREEKYYSLCLNHDALGLGSPNTYFTRIVLERRPSRVWPNLRKSIVTPDPTIHV